MNCVSFIAPPLSERVDGAADETTFSEATLWAGDIIVSTKPIRFSTLLGSCVAVCLYDAARRCGGMNHFLVPSGTGKPIYGDWATSELIARMGDFGSRPSTMIAKVFGGGSPLRLPDESIAVGDENAAVARRVLRAAGIPIAVEQVGHRAGIHVYFESWTGVAWVRRHRERN